MEIYFTQHAVERYEEQFDGIDSAGAKEFEGAKHQNEQLAREIMRAGVAHVYNRGRIIIIVNNLKVYGAVPMADGALLITNTWAYHQKMRRRLVNMPVVNMPGFKKTKSKRRWS